MLTGNHQALGRVADGLTVSARADDGVVEAVELDDQWVVGVQFHPEDGAADPAHLAALVRGIVDAAAAQDKSRPPGAQPLGA